ncbi:MAG TPA: CHAT domain-containing tetratricopeptide repeat protein [Acetobacteraceae bacterium]|nr:CHAT domain-containing tetratricopeptide repeat protein [Acetobacteraceae bacterium]
MRRLLAPLLMLAVACCARPSPEDYLGAAVTAGIDLGTTATGERCLARSITADTDAIYCNDNDLPAATVRRGPNSGAGELDGLATSSDWRLGVDLRLSCSPPVAASIPYAQSALLLRCTRRVGGWPQLALVASVDGRAYLADGIAPTLPAVVRTIAVMSGKVPAQQAADPVPSAELRALAAELSARAFAIGDVTEYDRLMALAIRANLSEDFESAATLYRAALGLQQKALGTGDPNTAVPLMGLALQLSDQGRFADADALFAQAAPMAAQGGDPTASARLAHYQALHLLNQGDAEKGLASLRDADRGYAGLVPPEATAPPTARLGNTGNLPSQRVLTDPVAQSALLGLVDVRRYEAIALQKLGETDEAKQALAQSEQLARANALIQPVLGARLFRTSGTLAGDRQDVAGASAGLKTAAVNFRRSLPLTRPAAETALLRAGSAMQSDDPAAALIQCRAATGVLRDLKIGVDPRLLEPCLAAFVDRAAADPSQQQALLAEMFESAELGQASITSELIAQAGVRLSENARDPRVASAIRRRQDAASTLDTLYRTRDELAAASAPGGLPYDGPHTDLATVDAQIAAAANGLRDSDAAVQEAAPAYGQLVQQQSAARDVLALLRPGEALAQITVGTHETWTLLLQDGQITLGEAATGLGAMNRLVVRVRATLQRGTNGAVPPFAADAARTIYTATLGTVAPALAQANALIVIPSGPLLSLPFALLPTTADAAGTTPFLIREMSVAHVPSAASFVDLRRAAGGSRASRPWFGFGDFRPVTLAEAERSFPGQVCGESAKAFASLPPLPFSRAELDQSRAIMGAGAADERLGAGFTADAVRKTSLKPYRVVHFSTHALLPAELACQPQPVIVTSAPPGAKSADGAMLRADDALAMDLDADAVILSACNSGGRGGALAGESLSALARAFFFAGSRALLATHWALNDAAAARIVTGTLQCPVRGQQGLADALRSAQLAMIDGAGRDGLPAEVAHPFFWAPMALIGDAGGRKAVTAALVTSASPSRR